jgi:biopolymer transport protein ExbB
VRKALLAFALFIPAVSQAWWSNDWKFRKEITLDLSATGANVTEPLTDVPVLVRLHAGNFGYFSDTKPDGSDLRFVAGDDKTPLQFHIERFDAKNQLAFLWVRVPQLAPGSKDTKIYLYYGNTKVGAAAGGASSYDANQAMVLHFSDAQSPPKDSTANNNNPSASTANLIPASLIGGGLKLEGTATLTVPASASLRLQPARGLTLSAWVRVSGPQTDANVMALEDQGNSIVLGLDGASANAKYTGGGQPPVQVKSADLTPNQWHHLAATISGSKLTLYVDGAESANAAVTPVEVGGTLTIGGSAAGGHNLTAELDEIEVSTVARPAGLIRAAARSQGVDAAMVVYGADAQQESGGTSYFVTTMQNVTPDGWAVIGLLAVMFVIALMVIVGKAIYLARVSSGNKAFLREFQKLRGDPTALDRMESEDGDEELDRSALAPPLAGLSSPYSMSTIFRLYHHGVEEMTGRIGLQSAGAAAVTSLTPQAIAAIRATMDATQVRLTQRLQSQMVLLTIAIAGGPFLGLLGTVIGVMITFAAIAASGDVNVNSIAPGIAAALAATVAGLAVAIPSLFAYNWLNTKIKSITADMRVFVDEFVTRVAEHYV